MKMKKRIDWHKKSLIWVKDRVFYASIPFTWCLPDIRSRLEQRGLFWDSAIVGGPAVYLMPDYFADIEYVSVGYSMPGILQKMNPLATRTTTGCIRNCSFCGVRKLEGDFKELNDWQDLPVICDNNLLAASQPHFDRVINRLKKWQWADFNQGLDSRLLTDYHAQRLAEIKKPMIRLALDNMAYSEAWVEAFEKLRRAGIAKSKIRSYALIGFDSDPAEAWQRCEWIEKFGIKVLPMWFNHLRQLERNRLTNQQKELSWSIYERRKIMDWFYWHKTVRSERKISL